MMSFKSIYMNDNGNQPAFPVTKPTAIIAHGLSKREYFASMAKTPDFILEQELVLWRGDDNRLPPVGSIQYAEMMKAIAAIDSAYAIYRSDALITQLNQQP